jgi:hypothetical protein
LTPIMWDALAREDAKRRKTDKERQTDLAWLAGSVRNTSREYIGQLSDDNKIGELIASVMKSNILTKRSDEPHPAEESLKRVKALQRQYPNAPEHLQAGWRADVVTLERELAEYREIRRKHGVQGSGSKYGFETQEERTRREAEKRQKEEQDRHEREERGRIFAANALRRALGDDQSIRDILADYGRAQGGQGLVEGQQSDYHPGHGPRVNLTWKEGLQG